MTTGRPVQRTHTAASLVLAVVAAMITALVVVTWGTAPALSAGHDDATFVAPFADGEISVAVQPGSVGRNQVHVYITDHSGRLREVTDPRLTIVTDRHRRDVEPTRTGPGHLISAQEDLVTEGAHAVTFTAALDGVVQQARGQVTIGPDDPTVAGRVATWCSLQLARIRD